MWPALDAGTPSPVVPSPHTVLTVLPEDKALSSALLPRSQCNSSSSENGPSQESTESAEDVPAELVRTLCRTSGRTTGSSAGGAEAEPAGQNRDTHTS